MQNFLVFIVGHSIASVEYLNRNLQHKEKVFMPDRVVITPLMFENVSKDGVHPAQSGKTQLVIRMFRVVGSYLYSFHNPRRYNKR